MAKYISAERLKEEIKRQADSYQDTYTDCMRDNLLSFIDYLQQEQPDENLDESARDYGVRGNANGVGGEDYAHDLAIAFKAGAEWMKDQLTMK